MGAANQLQLEANPFVGGAGSARAYRPLQSALREVIGHIASEIPIIVVAGVPGTGKTLLVGMAARACTEMGLRVSQFARGDLIPASSRENSDVLLIDDADSLTTAALAALLSLEGSVAATMIVFLCLPANVRRFARLSSRAAAVTLAPLTSSDARAFLLELATAAGRPELFSPGAMLLLVEGARGVPRILRSVADLAYSNAANEQSCEIGARHVADALERLAPSEPPKAEAEPAAAPAIAASTRPPAPKPPPPLPRDPVAVLRSRVRGRRRTADWMPHVIGGSAAFAASVALVGLVPSLIAQGSPQSAQAAALSASTPADMTEVGLASTIPHDHARAAPAAGKDARLSSVKSIAKRDTVPVPAPKPLTVRPKPRNVTQEGDDTGTNLATQEAAERAETEAANRAAIESAARDSAQRTRDPEPAIIQTAPPPEAAKEAGQAASRDIAATPPATNFIYDPEEVARQRELAVLAAERAREAKEAAAKRNADAAFAARRSASRDSMRSLFYSIFGVNGR